MTARFRFGKNWAGFLTCLDAQRVAEAKLSLQRMLGMQSLAGKTFLDIGSGSGLFSLAAHELGAEVMSFDYDADSVACTTTLRERYAPSSSRWKIEQGSALDEAYLRSLGEFDIVYSWGVLHHTGDMYRAFELVGPCVKSGGTLFLAIYNDQGALSKFWLVVKRAYNSGGVIVQALLLLLFGVLFEVARFFMRLISGKNPLPWVAWREKKKARGMSEWYDLVDWVGGYPFEVATPEQVFDFFHKRGFELSRLLTKKAGQGCCEYVFTKAELPDNPH